MNESIAVSAGSGRYQVRSVAVRCGADWSITVCGGEKPHIGAVALAQYEPERDSATVSVITVYSHRDDAAAVIFAKQFSAAKKATASVTVGIHIDDASEEELALLNANCTACLHALLENTEEKK